MAFNVNSNGFQMEIAFYRRCCDVRSCGMKVFCMLRSLVKFNHRAVYADTGEQWFLFQLTQTCGTDSCI